MGVAQAAALGLPCTRDGRHSISSENVALVQTSGMARYEPIRALQEDRQANVGCTRGSQEARMQLVPFSFCGHVNNKLRAGE